MENSWIKIYRKFLNWEWIDKPEMVSLWLYLLLTANYQDKQWHGITIKRGQTVVGRKKLSKILGISEKKIRTSLLCLKEANQITTKATNRFTLITLVKYEDYQARELKMANKNIDKRANKGPTKGHTLRKKEIKNINTLANAKRLPAKSKNKMDYVPVNDDGEVLIKRKGLKRPVTENPEPFDLKKKLAGLMSSPVKVHKIAGHYIARKGFKYENYEQYEPDLARIIHAAKGLKGYNAQEVEATMDYCQKNYQEWTLETICKKISEITK